MYDVYKCTTCSANLVGHPAIRKHLVSHGRKLAYLCGKCGKVFDGIRAVSGHYSRCSGRPVVTSPCHDPNSFRCVSCQREFKTYPGLRLHLKKAHPVAFLKSDIDAMEVGGTTNDRWIDEDIRLLALAEANLPSHVRFINQALARAFPGRTLESIKYKRRKQEYKELVISYQFRVDHDTNTANEIGIPRSIRESNVDLDSVRFMAITKRYALVDKNKVSSLDRALAIVVSETPSQVPHNFIEILKSLGRKDTRPRSRARFTAPAIPSNASKRTRKKLLFPIHQELFKNDRRRLVSHLLDELPINPGCLDIQVAFQHFHNIFGKDPQADHAPFVSKMAKDTTLESTSLIDPITAAQVEAAMKNMKKTGAAGPDRIRFKDMQKASNQQLATLFNIWFVEGRIPDELRINNTILLPKGITVSEDPNKWRPITIGSYLLRLYTRILSARLREATELNPKQKAFIPVDGCLENISLLDHVLNHYKNHNKSYYVMFLDLSKAFDSVHHSTIDRALDRQNVSSHFRRVVRDLYTGVSTRIVSEEGISDSIPIRCGVKQGCPLSPLLFNLVLDELLDAMPEHVGLTSCGNRLNAMAFADDLVIMAESKAGLTSLLSYCGTFFKERHMSINASKSAAFGAYVTHRIGDRHITKMIPISVSEWAVEGKEIPVILPEATAKYLGQKFGVLGKTRYDLIPSLDKWLSAVKSSFLKPQQKLTLIKMYVVPRLNYHFSMNTYNANTLNRIQLGLNKTAREILHLPNTSSKVFLTLPVSLGGLGLPDISSTACSLRHGALTRLSKSSDRTIRDVYASKFIQKQMVGLSKALGLPSVEADKPTLKQHLSYKLKIKLESFAKTKQGQGSEAFSHPAASSWINNSTILEGNLYPKAMALRTKTLPCRNNMAFTGCPTICRHCNSSIETTSHILQRCHRVQLPRMSRHNHVCKQIASFLSRKYGVDSIYTEPLINTPGGNFRPDLVVIDATRKHAYIADVAIPYEAHKYSLRDTEALKISKYNTREITGSVKEKFGVNTVSVEGLPIGARGALLPDKKVYCGVAFSSNQLAVLAQVAIKGSIFTFNSFMAL